MIKLQKDILLKNFTTFKIGGPAEFFAKVKELMALRETISWARQEKLPFFIFIF